MPRIARLVLPGIAHHVTQRGNNRQDVFFVDDDRRLYLKFLKQQADRYSVAILGYCLMTNHIHLLAVPAKPNSLAKALGRTHFLYSQQINRLHGRSGHLWQNRFYSCGVQDSLLLTVMRYIEQNPGRARLVRQARRWPWSSASAHCGLKADDSGLLDLARWKRLLGPTDWSMQLDTSLAEAEVSRIRLASHRGRPLASDSFLAKLEHKLGRRLRPLAIGRPSKRTTGGRKTARVTHGGRINR